MQQEISSGTMLGIVLIALAAVIGLGFGVFSIAKGVANEGTVGVQDNLGSVSNAAYDDYNDKIVTGTMVQSAINNFKGKSCAILVNTVAMDKAVKTYPSHLAKSIHAYKLTNGATGTTTTDSEGNTTTNSSLSSCQLKVSTNGDPLNGKNQASDKEHYYINYNALLDPASTGSLILKDGVYDSTGIPYAVDDTGKVAFDYSVGGLTRSGNCEYLNATAKFDANLIKDETGTILGIVFTQRAQ